MGQQQLLLVILVTVIVGIATVVAINTFSSASKAANRDAVTNDVVAIAASGQSYYIKPAMLNGGGNSFEGIGFDDLAFAGTYLAAEPLNAINVNGYFVISGADANGFTVTAHPASCDGYAGATTVDVSGNVTAITAAACAEDEQIEATVGPNSITWATGS